MFNMRKTTSPWHDVRLRQAANYAINREHLIRYATKGNGVTIPALVPAASFWYDPTLPPYPFDPTQARRLLHEAGYADGLSLTLIAPMSLEVQATVVSKMLEQGGFRVELQIVTPDAFNRQTDLRQPEQPPERQPWDIALTSRADRGNFPMYLFYFLHALDGFNDWVNEQPVLRHLYEETLRTVDQEQQQALVHQMERHTRD
jgi:ABC-type transport system substrate-binding protein